MSKSPEPHVNKKPHKDVRTAGATRRIQKEGRKQRKKRGCQAKQEKRTDSTPEHTLRTVSATYPALTHTHAGAKVGELQTTGLLRKPAIDPAVCSGRDSRIPNKA